MEWYNIKDKKPKKNEKVILCVKYCGEYLYYLEIFHQIVKSPKATNQKLAVFKSGFGTLRYYQFGEFRWAHIDPCEF